MHNIAVAIVNNKYYIAFKSNYPKDDKLYCKGTKFYPKCNKFNCKKKLMFCFRNLTHYGSALRMSNYKILLHLFHFLLAHGKRLVSLFYCVSIVTCPIVCRNCIGQNFATQDLKIALVHIINR